MQTPKNVQIPYDTFLQLLYVLDSIDLSNHDEIIQMEHEAVLNALREKKNAINARQAYANLISANKTDDESLQFEARIEYLQKRTKE